MSTADWAWIVLACVAALVFMTVFVLALCQGAARGDRQNEAARGQEVQGE